MMDDGWMDDAIPAVLNAWVDVKWCWEREKLEALGMKLPIWEMWSWITVLFACHVRFMLRGREENCKVGKRKLIGFYKVQLDIVWGVAVCVMFTEHPEWLWGWLLWVDVWWGLRSFVSELITIPLLQINLGAGGGSAGLSTQPAACCVLGQLWSRVKTTGNAFIVLTLF